MKKSKNRNKTKYEMWEESGELQSILIRMQGLAREGLSMLDIAGHIGISKPTLLAYREKYPNVKKALNSGKEAADFAVESALYKAALGGNITAIIYWLSNRQNKKWKRNPDLVPEGGEDTGKMEDLIKGLLKNGKDV